MWDLEARVQNRDIHIELQHVTDALPGQLMDLSFILNVQLLEAGVRIKVPRDKDYRKQITEFLMLHNHVPLSIQEKTASLEDAFITITRENIGDLVFPRHIYLDNYRPSNRISHCIQLCQIHRFRWI